MPDDCAGGLPMMRWKCTVAYEGHAYSGWQSQTHGDSVQEQIESALKHITGNKIRIVASGRTDKGVNAAGQVFHFDSDRKMKERKWKGAINAFLPADIHIMQVERVNMHFNARYCVREKQYDYRINLGAYDVFTRNSVFQCPYPLDVERMKEGAKYFIGTHDFTSLCTNSLHETENQVRTIYSVTFHRDGDIVTISFVGNGFLRHMVRMMTALLMEVGQGRRDPQDIPYILEQKSKTLARKNAHPEGLTLTKVSYFEILAETEEVVFREWLKSDGEECTYVLADRHTADIYGRFWVKENRMNGVLYQEGATGKMEQVSTELVKVLAQKGITVDEKGIIPLQKLNSIVQG